MKRSLSPLCSYRQECELQLGEKQAELAQWEGQLRTEHVRQSSVISEHQQLCQLMKTEQNQREELQKSLHEMTRKLVEIQRQKEDLEQALDKARRFFCFCLTVHHYYGWRPTIFTN